MKRALIAVAAAMALAAGVPGVASATTSTWTFQTAPAFVYNGYNQMGTVSCGSATFCVATFSARNGGMDAVDTWNGTTWSQQSVPTEAEAVSCYSAAACTVIGNDGSGPPAEQPSAAQWNGTTWTAVSVPNPGDEEGILTAISCPSATDCMAVGDGESSGYSIERWNAGTWQASLAPMPAGSVGGDLTSVSCVSADACTAVGYYYNETIGAPYLPVAESWNGSTWTIQATPATSGDLLLGVSCAAAANCDAVGANYGDPETSTPAPVALRWNGSSWIAESVPLPSSAKSGFLADVSCPAAGSCTAVGQYNAGSKDTSLALTEVWNGSKWATQTSAQPSSNKALAGVSCLAARTCTAVGSPEGAKPNHQPVVAEHE
jgi:hypothetical protein